MFAENTRGFLILLESRGADEILYPTFSNVKERKIFFIIIFFAFSFLVGRNKLDLILDICKMYVRVCIYIRLPVRGLFKSSNIL